MKTKINVVVELQNKDKYQEEYDIPNISSKRESETTLIDIISDCVETFETNKITIYIYDTIVYKNGKIKNKSLLFDCGRNYQKLVNLYNFILK